MASEKSIKPIFVSAQAVEGSPWNGHSDFSVASQKLWTQIVGSGLEALSDEQLLANLLALGGVDENVEAISVNLIRRFGSYSKLLSASLSELTQAGLEFSPIVAIKITKAAAQRLVKTDIKHMPVFDQWHRLMDYLHAALGHDAEEQCRALFLDRRNQLLNDEVLAQGTSDLVSIYLRDLVKRSIELDAVGIILVHNHPGGSLFPSREDIDSTQHLKIFLSQLGIKLYDHVIVSNGDWISLLNYVDNPGHSSSADVH